VGWLAIALLASIGAASAAAQLPRGTPADTGGWWHTAEALRPLVDRDGGPPARALALAEAELGLGRAERAVQVLLHVPFDDSLSSRARAVLGTASFATGDFALAGAELELAAAAYHGDERGVLLARAAEAYRLAGQDSIAVDLFRGARNSLPWIDGWLAVREAMVTEDDAGALRLLRRAAPEAARSAAAVRATVLLRAGDSTRALAALMQSQQWVPALSVATAVGDTAAARRAAFEALRAPDSVAVRVGVRAVRERFPPNTQQEMFELASGLRQTGRTREAVTLLEQAVGAGDSSSATLRRIGDLQSSIGARAAALGSYEHAAAQDDGPDAALAAYRRARLLTRSGQATAGHAALAAFANGYPEHENAALALYLVGSWYRDRGLAATADSVLEEVTRRWPADRYASRARITLAQTALVNANTSAAVGWYEDEVAAAGEERHAAQYFLGRLAVGAADTLTATRTWQDLARRDSLGYYGLLARGALAVGPAVFAPPPPTPESAEADVTLRRIDLLYASFLPDAAAEVIARQLQRREFEDEELVALAAGLIARGWVQEGVSLGWRAARRRTLGDPLVLRLVFPYPLRALVEREAEEHGLDPFLVAALVRQESNFRPTVVSRAGAVGLMQLMPATGRELLGREGIRWDARLLRSAELNLHLGTQHLATLLTRYDGHVIPALAAYNAGSRPVARWLRYPEATDSVQFVERIPYVETRGYVRAVLRNWSLYRALYPDAPPSATDGVP
jgi:soluble lytic murein transglycosylase